MFLCKPMNAADFDTLNVVIHDWCERSAAPIGTDPARLATSIALDLISNGFADSETLSTALAAAMNSEGYPNVRH